MQARIVGYSFRSEDKGATRKFYEAIGITFRHVQNGSRGHFSQESPSQEHLGFEIWTVTSASLSDSITIEVASIGKIFDAFKRDGIHVTIKNKFKANDTDATCCIKDPDGRDVVLVMRNYQAPFW